jgi:hypothetical protein
MVEFSEFNIMQNRAVNCIIARAKELCEVVEIDAHSLQMDLAATDFTCPLDLEKLLSFDDFSFIHDVTGIMAHLDRSTGNLKDHFLPRCFDGSR